MQIRALEAKVAALQEQIALQQEELEAEKIMTKEAKDQHFDLYQKVAAIHVWTMNQRLVEATNVVIRQPREIVTETDATCMEYLAAMYLAFGGITDYRNPFVCTEHIDELTRCEFTRVSFSLLRVLMLFGIPDLWKSAPSQEAFAVSLYHICREGASADVYKEYTERIPSLEKLTQTYNIDHICSVRSHQGSYFNLALENVAKSIDSYIDTGAILSRDMRPVAKRVGDALGNYCLSTYHTIRDVTKPLQLGYGSQWHEAHRICTTFVGMFDVCSALLYPEPVALQPGAHVGVFWKPM